MKNLKRVYMGVSFFMLCLAFLFVTQPVFAETSWKTAEISDGIQDDGGDCTLTLEHYTGGNDQTSYLLPLDRGWMTVRFIKEGVAVNADGQIVVDTFDEDYYMSSRKVLTGELPLWGGFYAASDAYYIVTGQYNLEQDDGLEVFRITKYDLNWNRLKSVGLSDCNTTVPFGYGCDIDVKGKNLIIHTCHTMYTASDGHRHQANATIMADTETMEITDTVTGIGGPGYVSHSFDQQVGFDGSSVVMTDLGDAYPRAAVISKLGYDISSGKLQSEYNDSEKSLDIMEFYGETGENYTGSAIGGFEIMNDSYLVVGNSVIQDEKYAQRKTRNIYAAAIDKDLNHKEISWLTSYDEGDGTVTTPQTVKISEQNCMVLWGRKDMVYYTVIDENGNQVSQIYQHKGFLSSCKPVLYHNRIHWFTVDGYSLDFYSISIAEPADFMVKETCKGHQVKMEKAVSDTCYVRCSVCNQQIALKVPVEFSPAYNVTGKDGDVIHYQWLSGLGSDPIKVNTGDTIYVSLDELEVDISISDENRLSYTRDEYFDGYFTALADGNVKVSMNLRWNPDLKVAFKVKIGNVPETPDSGEDGNVSEMPDDGENGEEKEDEDTDDMEQNEISSPAKGTKLTDKKTNAVYTVTKSSTAGGKVSYLKPLSRNVKKAFVPASVKINGISYKVTAISADAFKNHKKLKSVSIGNSVLSIGRNAFYGCSGLKNVSMGKNVKTIGDRAFYHCTAMTRIVIPEKVSRIGKQAFYGDKKLDSVVLQTQKLTSKKTGAEAFAGIGSGTIYTVPRVKADAYKKLLIAKGADL